MRSHDEGPFFGPLSQPLPAVAHALLYPDHPNTPNDPRLLNDLTDARYAQAFAREFSEVLRYDARRGCWRSYDATRWVTDESAAVRAAVEFAKMRQADALQIGDPRVREAAVIYSIRAESRRAIDNVLSLARHLPPMRDAGDDWDTDPWLLGCPNGVLDLHSGRLRASRPADRITLNTGVGYEPNAGAARWRRFVDEIFSGDRALVAFVQKAVGYSLTGDTSEQIALVAVGAGSNGKSTFLTTLSQVFGDYAHVMPFATVERQQRGAIPNDVAALVGRRFVTASEVNEGSRWNEARLKSLTGCEPITARFLQAEWFTFRPVAKFWFGINSKPDARDDSWGFWRRMRLIPYPCTFAIDKSLADALTAEASGILAWAVEGCLQWQREGLQAPTSVLEATAAYREDSDELSEFLEFACEGDPEACVGAAELYEHYKQWAIGRGLSERERLSSTMFGRKVSQRLSKKRTDAGFIYEGIARRPL